MASKALQAVVEIAGNVSPTLQNSIEEAASQLEKVNLKAVAVGAAVAGIAVASAKAVIDGGKYMLELGTQFDKASDSIRVGTGATGEALDDLINDFDAVYSSVPTTMDDTAQAIADYNTRLGLTGDVLQDLSVQAIQVSDLLGEGLGSVIEESSQAFQQWGKNPEEMAEAMDFIFKASQETGMGFNSLMTNLQSYGPQLQELGYSFEEAATFMGQLDKAGVNTNEVLGAMKKSVATLAKEGIDASEGIAIYTEKIKNADNAAEAAAIASEIFGSKAGSTMAAAIRDGTFEIEELTAALIENEETIGIAAADTYDFSEKLQVFRQQAEVAFRPLASSVFDSINNLMPVVTELMQGIIPIISELSTTLVPIVEEIVPSILPMLQSLLPTILIIAGTLATELIPPIVEIVTSFIPILVQLLDLVVPLLKMFAADLLPTIASLIQKLLPPIIKIISTILPSLIKLISTVFPILEEIFNTILPVALELIDALLPIILELVEAVLPILISILDSLMPILELVMILLEPLLEMFLMLLDPILNLITMAIGPLTDIFINLIENVLEPLSPALEFLADIFTNVLGKAIESISPLIKNIMDIFTGLIDFIVGIFTGDWSKAWEGVVKIFDGIIGGIANLFKIPMNFVIDGINMFLESLNKISIPDWVPVVGGNGFEIPLIPKLAKGGFTDGISIAGEAGTEAVISFDPAYHQDNIGYWKEAGRILGANNISSNIIKSLPAFQSGGFTDGISIAGEAGTEAVISFDPAYRQDNIGYWAAAGRLLGLDDFSLSDLAGGGVINYYDFSGFTWSPQIGIVGENNSDFMDELKKHEIEFFEWLKEFVQSRKDSEFCNA